MGTKHINSGLRTSDFEFLKIQNTICVRNGVSESCLNSEKYLAKRPFFQYTIYFPIYFSRILHRSPETNFIKSDLIQQVLQCSWLIVRNDIKRIGILNGKNAINSYKKCFGFTRVYLARINTFTWLTEFLFKIFLHTVREICSLNL